MGIYLATAIGLILYMVLAWFAGSWLRLQGASLWLVRGGLALIGIVGAGVFFWFYRKLTRDASETGVGPGAAVLTEIDALLNQADQKLKSSKLTAGASLRSLPIVFLLGEPNSAKTSTVLRSGLDPELLAGVVFRETETVLTNTLNLWYARGTVFIEVGGAILGEGRVWARVLNRTNPSGFAAALGRNESAPRAAVVCCDCERIQSGTEKLVATARRLSASLQTMANTLGASFPVYVLFTKLDQVPKFAEFVSNLTSDETKQILGATVAQRDPRQGVFAEEEKNRLGREFDQLVYSLAEKRLDYLSRENAPNKLPAIYEFPRELRKTKDKILTFLVELSRPSQLGTNSFMRGFYFSGVRPVMVRENVAGPAPVAESAGADAGATRVLSVGALGGTPAGLSPVNIVRSRRVPEWTFLPYLFSEVVLRDRAALETSSRSSNANVVRRVLLACLVLLFLCGAIGIVASYLNNRGQQLDVMTANKVLAGTVPGTVDVPTVEQLKELEKLRAVLASLEANQKEGAPWSYRWGLYNGDRLYPEARRVYFGYFRRLLLDSTQKSMVATLRQLPAKPGANDSFQEPYEALKAHLITTSNHDKSSKTFLSPVLLRVWSAGKTIDSERMDRARQQFEYYSEALVAKNPYSIANNRDAVINARNYLKQFGGIETIYQNLIAAAGKDIPAVSFTTSVVASSYVVKGAFTGDGFKAAQRLLRDPARVAGGEEWVLGERNAAPVPGNLQQDLRSRYYGDYVNQWRRFLGETRVVGYTNLRDAGSKLQTLSGNSSPLLQLLWVVQKNTNVDIPNFPNAFQPVQQLAREANDQRLITASSQPYMGALATLQGSVAALASNTNPQADPAPVLGAATAAHGVVTPIAQSFLIDNAGHVDKIVARLLDDPITNAENLVRKIGPAQLNAAGAAFCQQYNVVASKYPFSGGPADATLQDLDSVFKPGTGALWTFFEASFKAILTRQGSQFEMNPSAPMRISADFIRFMNHAAGISEAFYPAGAQQPKLTYTLKQLPSKGVDKLNLIIDDQTLSGDDQSKQFTWTGNTNSSAQATVSYSGGNLEFAREKGLWAPFHFLDGAKWIPGSTTVLEWPIEIGHKPAKLADGTDVVIRYEFISGAQMFRRGSVGMQCPAVGAR